MTGGLADPNGGADHYHRDDVRPAGICSIAWEGLATARQRTRHR